VGTHGHPWSERPDAGLLRQAMPGVDLSVEGGRLSKLIQQAVFTVTRRSTRRSHSGWASLLGS
jgi:hypothetical protein